LDFGLSRLRSEGVRHSPGTLVTARRKDGSEFPAEISMSSSLERGKTVLTAVIRDMTDRVLAQEAIESLSRHYELLLTSAGEGIVGLEADGTVSYLNPAATALFGRDAADLLGEELHSKVHQGEGGEGSRCTEECPILTSLQEGTCFRGEVVFFRKDGTPFPTATSLTPIMEGGAVTGGVMIFEDITHRKEQEDALRASEERFRGLVEHATYGIYQSTAEGRFQAVNPALVEILGYDSPEEVLALDLARDVYADPEERKDLVATFQREGTFMGAEATWVRKDGTTVPVRLSGRSIWGPDGVFQLFEVMVENLSERKTLENQLRQAQKMEAVGQLTGGIAHDFNNVLSVILLNSELLAASVEGGDPVELRDIQAIQDSAKRASSITRKLLGFSRKAELLMEPVQLDKIAGDMTPMLRTLLPESIELTVDVVPGVGPVLADTGSVEQMLLNLVGNSRDALPKGGRVSVRVSDVEVDDTYAVLHPHVQPGQYVCLEVSDNGTGMDEETLKRVFDPFFSTKASGAGTGLGMAMVYGLTKQQDGYVNIDSELGVGTTTHLCFPTISSDETWDTRDDPVDQGTHASATILLVEDEENLAAATRRALEGKGYEVILATNGLEALELFRDGKDRIDLVLSDLVLPGLGGIDLLDQLQQEHGPIRFILTSGYSGKELDVGERDITSLPFLRKPWILTELLRVIKMTLNSELQFTENIHGQHPHHDDDPEILRALRRVLESKGHSVSEASDGKVALRRFAGNPPDLVITDIYMPEMDGIEFIIRVREAFPEARILAMSGGGFLSQDRVLGAASLLGAEDVLEKPFTGEEVLDQVTRVLQKP
jgi:two-component system NtrC family sensor kinase